MSDQEFSSDGDIALEKLREAIDASAPADHGALILLEVNPGPFGDTLRMIEELGRAWESEGKRVLVVDAHPEDPFLAPFLPLESEGFSEILHYGLGPDAVVRRLEGLPCLWISAGTLGSLSLEDPAEPRRTLKRLVSRAERVLLLASPGNQEGWLPLFREASSFRFRRSEEAPSEESPAPLSPPPSSESGDVEKETPRERWGHRHWPYFLIVVVLMIWAAWYFLQDPERGNREERTSMVLPPPDPLSVEEDRIAEVPPLQTENILLPEEPATPVMEEETSLLESFSVPEEEEPAYSGFEEMELLPEQQEDKVSESTTPSEPEKTRPEVVEAPKTAPWPVQRRKEGRSSWKTALDHEGSFHVHVSSYRDSSRALRDLADERFPEQIIVIRRARVGDRDWFRICVGEFEELSAACAFRDSLLDEAGLDYCAIGINPVE
ncbi:MAG: hypothetical protein QF492_06960 [Candidatus Krumholzibacteria bacterium]|jgi:cell division protein FtsN|nr:hypothetical protein [Candidatus Krumholzibacteria bacterium]MDP6669624.1 hypothetical protein [Candidatus Krumholzibacteria bacterium]MDP6797625.1 hypothetical protein [Candidatus Krumholzibacteria bacterium]MDP7021656.1 hypothetical protein [Candidatus Krumholzibacteria bacterium]